MIELRFKYDEEFRVTSLRRYRRQHRARHLLAVVKALAALLLLALAAFGLAHGMPWLTVFFVCVVILLFSGHLIDLWIFKRRLRRSPFRNEEVVITLAEEGVHGVSQKSDATLSWSAFTKACRFRDGFLLFQGPESFSWLPTPNLAKESQDELESLIRDKIKKYRDVEPAA